MATLVHKLQIDRLLQRNKRFYATLRFSSNMSSFFAPLSGSQTRGKTCSLARLGRTKNSQSRFKSQLRKLPERSMQTQSATQKNQSWAFRNPALHLFLPIPSPQSHEGPQRGPAPPAVGEWDLLQADLEPKWQLLCTSSRSTRSAFTKKQKILRNTTFRSNLSRQGS